LLSWSSGPGPRRVRRPLLAAGVPAVRSILDLVSRPSSDDERRSAVLMTVLRVDRDGAGSP
jgi:hypothetical protein